MISGSTIALVAVPLLVGWGIWRRSRGASRHRLSAELLALGYASWLAGLLFFPIVIDPVTRADLAREAAAPGSWVNLVPLRTVAELLARDSSTQAVRQLGGNLLLFVVPGMALAVLSRGMRRFGTFLSAATAIALGIEALQCVMRLACVGTRSVDIDDVVLNVAGLVLGWATWRLLSSGTKAPAEG